VKGKRRKTAKRAVGRKRHSSGATSPLLWLRLSPLQFAGQLFYQSVLTQHFIWGQPLEVELIEQVVWSGSRFSRVFFMFAPLVFPCTRSTAPLKSNCP
jgi:hypothetical protein